MSDGVMLQDARMKADRLREMQDAAARLPELEQEAQKQAIVAGAQAQLQELVPKLHAANERFSAALAASDVEVRKLAINFSEVVNERRRVAKLAAELRQLARDIAVQVWIRDAPGQAQTIQTRHDIEAEAEQQLINLGHLNAQLMSLPEPGDDVGRALVQVVARLCGDVVRAPIIIGPTAGRVLVSEFDPARNESVDVWR